MNRQQLFDNLNHLPSSTIDDTSPTNSYKFLMTDENSQIHTVPFNSLGTTYYVNGWDGANTNDGLSWDTAFKTMAKAFTVIGSNDTIYLTGRITETLTAPLGVYDVTIIGTTNVPRQSTNNGVQAGYSAYWKYSAETATACLELIEQGWTIKNIVFEPYSTGTGIQLTRAEDAVHPDPSHALITNCRFVTGANGIVDSGGCFNLRIINNVFQAQTGHAIKNIAGAGIACPSYWQVLDNKFLGFTNGFAVELVHSVIKGNYFTDGGTPNNTTVLNIYGSGTAGGNNFVVDNYFQTATANFNTPDIIGNSTDVWNNTSIDGEVGFIGREVGNPA